MKKNTHKRLSRKVIIATIAIPALMCLAIIFGICLNAFFWFFLGRDETGLQQATIESASNSQSLVLSLIGVAISVWIGLNIYNVLSREELKELLEQAEDAANITAKVYTEALKSKFRVSFSDRTSNYFITRLDSMDLFPDTLLEKILELEDLFNFSYDLYCDGLSTNFNKIGAEKAGDLIAYAEKQRTEGLINKEQIFFLRGYCSLRGGDFLYFQIQFDEALKGNENELVENAVKKYKAALYNLFRIRDIRHCGKPENYAPEERIALAILANNIGSMYLLKPAIINKLDETQLDEIIEAERVAVNFSTEISDLTRSVYIRNLGVAYEKRGKKDEAFEQYCRAYSLNHKSWKAAHCIGAWYGKKLRSQFTSFPAEDGVTPENIDEYCKKLSNYAAKLKPREKKDMIDLLLKSAYWYEVKAANKDRLMDKWLMIRYNQLYILTGNEMYRMKKEESEKQLEYQKEVLTGWQAVS